VKLKPKGGILPFEVPDGLSLSALVEPNGPYSKPIRSDGVVSINKVSGDYVIKFERPPGKLVYCHFATLTGNQDIPGEDIAFLVAECLTDLGTAELL
jgi:hypothetical protein